MGCPMSNAIHCPLCNATKPAGLGLVVYEQSALLECRCRGCGEIFFASDRREEALVQLAKNNDDDDDD